MTSLLKPTPLIALGALALAMLTGCASAVPMEPAADATNPDCAEIIVRLPDSVDDFAKRQTNAQATGAWGNPAAILLKCGVEVPAPSTLPCYTIKDVDWLRDSSNAPTYIFTTYGRDPAVQVVIDGDIASSSALLALSNAVGSLPAERHCTSPEDVYGEG